MRPLTSGSAEISGPAGPLEALVDAPAAEDVRAAAVVCHPHPLHGGTLHNKVVFTLARAFRDRGVVAVRFNFRGVGGSAGDYDGGTGEREDVVAVAAWCREHFMAQSVFLAGFSFGAAMSLAAAEPTAARGLVTVALPVQRVAGIAPPRCPWLAVHGGRDELVPADAFRDWAAALATPPQIALLPNADHFLHGELPALAEHVRAFLVSRFAELADEPADASRAG